MAARALRRRRAAVSGRRSRSRREGRIGNRPHAEDAAAGYALRDARRGAGLSRSVGPRWADTRIHGTTKRQVAVMFAEEHPTLQPLPLEPFRYYRSACGPCISMAASRSTPPITPRRPAGSAAVCPSAVERSPHCLLNPATGAAAPGTCAGAAWLSYAFLASMCSCAAHAARYGISRRSDLAAGQRPKTLTPSCARRRHVLYA